MIWNINLVFAPGSNLYPVTLCMIATWVVHKHVSVALLWSCPLRTACQRDLKKIFVQPCHVMGKVHYLLLIHRMSAWATWIT